MRALLIAILAVTSLAVGCSDFTKPPEGRWQGAYTADDVIIAARVEIQADGRVRLSAPNAYANFATMPIAEKRAIEQRLVGNLVAAWPQVSPRDLDFDGKVLRNPGGVAPQLERDAKTGHMTMFVYPGSKPSIRVDLEPTDTFAN